MFLKPDIWGALKFALVPAMVTVMLTDLFDSLSTFVGVAEAAKLVDEKGAPKNLRQGLIVDSFATLVLIPLTFAITQGILWGLAAVSIALLVIEHVH